MRNAKSLSISATYSAQSRLLRNIVPLWLLPRDISGWIQCLDSSCIWLLISQQWPRFWILPAKFAAKLPEVCTAWGLVTQRRVEKSNALKTRFTTISVFRSNSCGLLKYRKGQLRSSSDEPTNPEQLTGREGGRRTGREGGGRRTGDRSAGVW